MKKQYLLMAAFASTLAFTACTNDDDLGNIPGQGVTTDEGATFEISISNNGSGTTKGVRPVGSSAADNNVDKVQLKIYKEDATDTWKAVTLANTEETATGGSLYLSIATSDASIASINAATGIITYNNADVTEGVPGDVDRENHKVKVTVKGLEASTDYKIVAIGYNGTDFPYGTFGTDITDNKGVFTTTANAKSGFGLEEIFADSKIATTTKNMATDAGSTDIKFNVAPNLVLTRQVAGILAYMQYVPAAIDGKRVEKVVIRANRKVSNFSFPAEDCAKPEFNGVKPSDENSDDLMTFTMANIATNYPTAPAAADAIPEEGFYTFNSMVAGKVEADGEDNNQTAKPFCDDYEAIAPTDLALVENSIFGARFILPYDQHYADAPALESTLTIVFLGASDEELLVRKVTTDKVPTTESGSATYYDIRCNNFYSIGKKLATDTTDKDEEDDDDDDTPIDLRSDNIVLLINDAWDVLHNMEVPE